MNITDTERMAVIAAEREVVAIRILAEHAPLSDIAAGRLGYALHVISKALQARREVLGMSISKTIMEVA